MNITSWFPITMLVSILHRASGVALYAGTAVLLWMLGASLDSEESFVALQDMLASPLCQFIVWLTLAALAYHMVAGLRHLIMDMGFGEEFESGRRGALIAFVLAMVLVILTGVWVW